MNALEDFSLSAVRGYLESAVFIDDHIFDQAMNIPKLPPDFPVRRKPIFNRGSEASSSIVSAPSLEEEERIEKPYHPKELVNSFAREGITCALYEPSEGFSTDPNSEIFKLCERPDIVILDWDFSGDSGAKILNLIVELVDQSARELPHHTRLIAIYTADQSLVAVANTIADRLHKHGRQCDPEKAQCRLRSGATRLIVLGKPIGRFGDEDEQFTVKESDLAAKLIQEFATMNSGLLPSYALHGLAAIRKHSNRILDRFHGDLDSAFLLHRALVSASEEAFNQLPELLAEEIRAVIEDQGVNGDRAREIAEAALSCDCLTEKDKELVGLIEQRSAVRKVVNKLKEPDSVPIGHQRLAALFSTRTQYSDNFKTLGFGTIVRFKSEDAASWMYAFCLVPDCDSLRLDSGKPAQFPFWTVVENVYTGQSRRRGMVLTLSEGAQISLSAGGSAADMLWIASFTVDPASKTVIAKKENGSFKFQSSDRRIEWIGQLKPLHAHRIAHDITEGLSRVGVCEAEWLRVLCGS